MVKSLNEQYTRANEIVRESFKNKVDKVKEPYINHLLRVRKSCLLLFSHRNISSEVRDNVRRLQIVALLHDLLEDCSDWDVMRLKREGFSKHIIEAVECLTKKKGESYFKYLNRVSKNHLATIVKIFDLRDNLDLSRYYLTDSLIDTKGLDRVSNYLVAHRELMSHFKKYLEEIYEIDLSQEKNY